MKNYTLPSGIRLTQQTLKNNLSNEQLHNCLFYTYFMFQLQKSRNLVFAFLPGKIYLSCKTFVVLKFLFQIYYTQSLLSNKILHLLINPFTNNMPDVVYHMSKDSYSNVHHPVGTVQCDLATPYQERISHSHHLESGLAL